MEQLTEVYRYLLHPFELRLKALRGEQKARFQPAARKLNWKPISCEPGESRYSAGRHLKLFHFSVR
jgi:hypothetical protein